MEITFLGHSAFSITSGDTDILIDPFLTGNPKASVAADDVSPTHILLSHGHADHFYGLQALKGPGVEVWAHAIVRDYLATEAPAARLVERRDGDILDPRDAARRTIVRSAAPARQGTQEV